MKTFDYLYKYHPEYKLTAKLEARYAYRKIFGQPMTTKSHRSNLFNTLGEIKQSLEDFLLWKEVKKDSYNRDKMLLDIYRKRNVERFYNIYFDKAWNRLETDENQDMWNEYNRMELSYLKYFYKNEEPLKSRIKIFNKMIQSLQAFWINASLRFGSEKTSIEQISNLQVPFLSLDEAIKLAKNQPFINNKFNQINLLILELYEESNFQKFQLVRDLIFENYHFAEKGYQKLIYGFLINFTAAKIKTGDLNYKKESLLIYKFGLETKLILEDGLLSSITFNNIIKVACDLDELEFAISVVDKYGNYIPEGIKADSISISMAMILFEKGQYEEALIELNTGEFFRIDLGFKFRGLKLQCLYELKEYDLLFYHFKAFESWVRRNSKKLGNSNELACYNLIKFTRILARPIDDIDIVKQQINLAPYLFFRSWLLNKVDTLK